MVLLVNPNLKGQQAKDAKARRGSWSVSWITLSDAVAGGLRDVEAGKEAPDLSTEDGKKVAYEGY